MAVKGIPVSIVETGFGTPVSPVEGNAPLMTAVDTGFGTPISIVETGYGAPFVVQGYAPTPPEDSIEFTFTAGSNDAGTEFGYSSGDFIPAYGTLDSEHVPGSSVVAAAVSQSGNINIVFSGDILDEVSGKSIWIGEYEIPSPSWQYVEGVGTYYDGPSPIMFDVGSTYTIEINYPSVPISPFAAFTVDAGTGNDGDTGYYSTIYGGVSAEPLAGFPLLEFSTRNENYTQVAFTGDCLTTVSGWVPVIDGVTIGAAISDWAFDGEYTTGTWESTGAMVETQQYAITWEQPA